MLKTDICLAVLYFADIAEEGLQATEDIAEEINLFMSHTDA